MATSTPETLSLRRVVELCAENTHRFFSKVVHDETYCMELFRRAMVEKDGDAWSYIISTYEGMATGWARKKIAGSMAISAKECVDDAFSKMWVSLQKRVFSDFRSLSAFLEYLRSCVHTVILDRGRSQDKHKVLRRLDDVERELASEGDEHAVAPPITETKPTETEVTTLMDSQALWQWVMSHCRNEREELVMRALFQEDLKPAEIMNEYGQMFDDVNDIYRIRRNVLLRLTQDRGNAPQ